MTKLIILRHGHRDLSDRSADNGLNQDGKKQAQLLAETIAKLVGPKTKIFSSQRLRCQETLAPLAAKLKLKIEVDPKLLERNFDEDARQFARRIKEFFGAWKSAPEEAWIVCTHGDWIPWFFELATGASVDFNKGSWAELNLKADGSVEVSQLKQAK